MNEIDKYSKVAESVTQPDSDFKGYTLDELRYQRAFVALQKEFCKAKLLRSVGSFSKMNPFARKGPSLEAAGKFGPVLSKVMKGFGYLDYVMIGFSVFNSVRKFTSFFRRKR